MHDKNGNALPLACAIVICLLLVSSVVMEYLRLTVIADEVRNALQTSIISVSTGNYDETYNGLREGYSGGYSKAHSGEWRENLDEGDVYSELDDLLGLDDTHTKWSDNKEEYRLSGLNVSVLNSPFAPLNPDDEDKLSAEAKITLEVPLSFGWSMLPPMKISLRATASYISKF